MRKVFICCMRCCCRGCRVMENRLSLWGICRLRGRRFRRMIVRNGLLSEVSNACRPMLLLRAFVIRHWDICIVRNGCRVEIACVMPGLRFPCRLQRKIIGTVSCALRSIRQNATLNCCRLSLRSLCCLSEEM